MELIGRGVRQRSIRDGETIGVGGHHAQHAGLQGDEDARENSARLIFGYDARNTLDHSGKLMEGNFYLLVNVHTGKTGEILSVQGADRERRRVAGDESLLVGSLDMDCSIGKVFHNLREQLTGHHRAAFLLNERGHGVLNGELQVGGLEDDFVASGLDEDTGQDRERRSSGNPFEDNGQGVGKLGAIDTEFQGMPLFVMA